MTAELPVYIATLRAVFSAADDVEAIMIADQIKVNGEKDLEDSDSLDVTQVTQNAATLSPEGTLNLLRRARNALIRTRIRTMLDCAREIDKCTYILANRTEGEPGIELAGYDYGKFLEISREVLAGGNPLFE